MPIYLFRCETCGQSFEKLMSFSESNIIPECPYCHSPQTEKQVATFASQFNAADRSGSGSCGSSGRFT